MTARAPLLTASAALSGTSERARTPPVIAPAPAARDPRAWSARDVVALQRSVGNAAVTRLLKAAAPRPNRTGLPEPLKAGVEHLSGLAMDDVRVHYNSAEPAMIGALAYAQGGNIHVGPGQERHLPHEAWHVVQQMQGRVQPTRRVGGLALNDDRGLELEADIYGARATNTFTRHQQQHDRRTPAAARNESSRPVELSASPPQPRPSTAVVQRVGEEKIAFDPVVSEDDADVRYGLRLLRDAIERAKEKRRGEKKRVWKNVEREVKEEASGISETYSAPLEELGDEQFLQDDLAGFLPTEIKIRGNAVFYVFGHYNVRIATLKKGKGAFVSIGKPPGATRNVFAKSGTDQIKGLPEPAARGGQYIKDSRGTITRRYAYLEKSYWQFMEFLHTQRMEGRYQKFMRVVRVEPDVRDADSEVVRKAMTSDQIRDLERELKSWEAKRQKGSITPAELRKAEQTRKEIESKKPKRLTLEQLAFVHQYWGSGSQQRGLSLTSTPKPGVTIGNAGDNFRTDYGFRIKIDLAKIPENSAILINHYAHGGTKDVIGEGRGDVETDPYGKGPYKYRSSVIKNRELYLEYLKPEWIVEIEEHPSAKAEPGLGESKTFAASKYGDLNRYLAALKKATGADDYGSGFVMALKGRSQFDDGIKTYISKLDKFEKDDEIVAYVLKLQGEQRKEDVVSPGLRSGILSGIEYLRGFNDGSAELMEMPSRKDPHRPSRRPDYTTSKRQSVKNRLDDRARAKPEIAKLTIEDMEHREKTDIYRIGYLHGRSGASPAEQLSKLI